MSSISIAPNPSGTGIFTVAAPNSNTNQTLTLPNASGTLLTNSGTEAGAFSTLSVAGNNISAASGFQRNKLINGNFEIWQRGTSVTGIGGGALTYLADRWGFEGMGSTSARVTYDRAADSPAISAATGYSPFSARFTVTTTGGVATNDFGVFRQFIEGFNFEDLYQRAFTISFWVKSSVAGTYGVSIYGGGVGAGQTAGTPSFTQTYTINAANTWEFKTIAVPASPAGTLANWDFGNGRGLDVMWRLWSNPASPAGTLGVWDTGTYSIPAYSQTNLAATNGATWQIAQVQLEVGTVATPFERRPFGTELMLCQRYFEKSFGLNQVPAHNTGEFVVLPSAGSLGCGGNTYFSFVFKVSKRAANGSLRLYDPYSAQSAAQNWWRSYPNNCSGGNAIGPNSGFVLDVYENYVSGYCQAFTDGGVVFNWTVSSEL